MFPTVMLVANVASVAVLWFGGHRVESGQMQIGALTAYLDLPDADRDGGDDGHLHDDDDPAVGGVRRPDDGGARHRLVRGARRPTGRRACPSAARSPSTGVEFSYPGADAPVLHDLTFRAEPGQTVAVIGSTGAGKSTLVNLVPRLFDATGGTVAVDGVDVRDLEPDLLWSVIGLVPQKAYLFCGTVRSNLLHGKTDATDEELWQALEIAQADDFVRAMPEGLDAPIAQGGTNVSGGQRQRLAIARAVVRRPEIYLFDDSFSALDLATDARLRAALRPVTRDATVLLVAQRVSTIRDADLILVLEDGRVVGRGTHRELLDDCPTYQEIVASQLSAEEAA